MGGGKEGRGRQADRWGPCRIKEELRQQGETNKTSENERENTACMHPEKKKRAHKQQE